MENNLFITKLNYFLNLLIIIYNYKSLFMRAFILFLILIFCFQSWTKADDIRDFEIEGMSIGDSLLNYFSEEEIKENEKRAMCKK